MLQRIALLILLRLVALLLLLLQRLYVAVFYMGFKQCWKLVLVSAWVWANLLIVKVFVHCF